MASTLDGNGALVLDCDLKDSCYFYRITWLHATSMLDFLCFCVPDSEVRVVGGMKGGGKFISQLLTLGVVHVSIEKL